MRERAARLVAAEPWGRAQWERLSEGLLFDGMESWLPWLTDDEHLLPDLLPDDALVLLVEPSRMRDRVTELNDEETSLAPPWPAPGAPHRGRGAAPPRSRCPSTVSCAHTGADTWTVLSAPDRPGHTYVSPAPRWRGPGRPGGVRGPRWASSWARVTGWSLAADGTGSAERIRRSLADEGLAAPVVERAPVAPGASVVVAPLHRGFVLPSLRLAVVSEADLTGRRRVHRRPAGEPDGARTSTTT